MGLSDFRIFLFTQLNISDLTDNESIVVSQREIVNDEVVSLYSEAEIGPHTPASTTVRQSKTHFMLN